MSTSTVLRSLEPLRSKSQGVDNRFTPRHHLLDGLLRTNSSVTSPWMPPFAEGDRRDQKPG